MIVTAMDVRDPDPDPRLKAIDNMPATMATVVRLQPAACIALLTVVDCLQQYA
jgi:hypothetical protein